MIEERVHNQNTFEGKLWEMRQYLLSFCTNDLLVFAMPLIFHYMHAIQIFIYFLFSYSIHVKLKANYNHFRMVSYSIQVLKVKIPLENRYSWWLKIQMNNEEIKPVRQQMSVQEEISVKKKKNLIQYYYYWHQMWWYWYGTFWKWDTIIQYIS